MSGGLLQRAEAIFLSLAEMPSERWDSELHLRCAGDRELLKEVRSLLECHVGDRTFLDADRLASVRPFDVTRALEEEELVPGSRIGEFVVQRFLGRGGMGNVYVAEQAKPRRTVALKVIRRGFASPALIRRFEHEAEFLGRLHHPGIAQIHAAGAAAVASADGTAGHPQPFIAMELVNGPTLTEFVRLRGLSHAARMEIMAKVCDAVQHAHQRGVIHRDLKPQNILVDEAGQPKILDFGVARAADPDADMVTLHTRAGQIVGTLPYMSPEQVVGDADEVDTRSDVYTLGVILYQLLSGRLPIEVSGRSIAEAARIIAEQTPARLGLLDRSMRGDIETIAARAIEKDKSRRYQSAAELADDLRRYIGGSPIVARQDSALYVIRKQIRRHKGPVATAAAVLVGIMVFALYATGQARKFSDLASSEEQARRRAESARDEADSQRGRADQAASRLARELTVNNIERGRLIGRSGSLAGAEGLLWPEHLRDLNSRHTFFALWELYSRHRSLATLDACGRNTQKLRLSHDGALVGACGIDPPVIIHDTSTLETVATFGDPGIVHTALAFSPRGDLATGNAAGKIVIRAPGDWKERLVLVEQGQPVTDAAFDRYGDHLVAVFSDGSVAVFDVRPASTGERRLASRADLSARVAVCSPAEDLVVVGATDARLRVLTLDGLDDVRDIANPDDNTPRLGISADGTMVAAGGASRLTRVWELSSGELLATLRAPNGSVQGVAFTPDGSRVVTVGWWNLHVWELGKQHPLQTFTGFRMSGGDLAVTPDGSAVWGNFGTTIKAWELDPDAGRIRIPAEGSRTLAVFAPDAGLVTAEGDGRVSILQDGTWETSVTLGKHARRVRAVAISPTEPLAASASVDGVVVLWNLAQRREVARWPGHRMITNDGLRFDPTGRRLVVPSGDNTFKVLSIPDGEVLATLPSDRHEVLSAAFSPDGGRIATTTRRGPIRIHDAQTGEPILECESPGGTPWAVTFSPDGERVLCGTWTRTIDIFNARTGRLERRLDGHSGLVTDLAFRPNEPTILASSGADGQVMLWDLSVAIDTPVLTLDGFSGWEVWALDFDPRGRRLLATDSMGLSIIWDLRYFNRHIGGNMASWIDQNRSSLGEWFDENAALEQRRLLLGRGVRSAVTEPSPPAHLGGDAGISPPR